MLAPPELEIVRGDSVVPRLALLLDPEEFAETLSRSWPEIRSTKTEITYVRYKAQKSCLVLYRLTSNEGVCQVYAKAHPNGAPVGVDPPEGRALLEGGSIAAFLFPEDKQMRVISELWNLEKRIRLLARFVPEIDFANASLKPLTYLPERRFVCRVTDNNEASVALKAHDENGFASARACTATFHSTDRLQIANRIEISDRYRLLAYEWLPGDALNERLLRPDFDPRVLELVGEALAELHHSKQAGLRFLAREQEASTVVALAEHLTHICSSLAIRIQFLSKMISGYLLELPNGAYPIHADFSAKQVVVGSEAIGIIDLDRAALGDPALDLGNFLAYLERDVIYRRLSPERLPVFREALLAGYDKIRKVPPLSDIDFYIAAGLFRLLPDPFRYHEPAWDQLTESILRRTEQLCKNFSKHFSHALEAFPQQLNK